MAYIPGTMGVDNLLGGPEPDLIRGGDGDDRLDGNPGNDRLFGEADNDRLLGSSDDDILFGDFGDIFDSQYTTCVIWAGGEGNPIGNDTLDGGSGNDVLFGDTGVVLFEGAEGNPTDSQTFALFTATATGGGNDSLDGGTSNDIAFGNGGDDTLIGGSGNDTLFGDGGYAEGMIGGMGFIAYAIPNPDLDSNLIDGNNGNDFLVGAEGTDTIRGGGGEDTLDGGEGMELDYLSAGSSNDVLLFDLADMTADMTAVGSHDGGTSVDRLQARGAGTLDLTGIPNDHLINLEIIDLEDDGGGQLVYLDTSDALALSSTTNTVFIEGGTEDTASLTALGFTAMGTQTTSNGQDPSETYNRYVGGGATVLVDQDITVI